MVNTVAELTWLTFILKDLHIPLTSPPIIYYDNRSAMHIMFHTRNKYIKLNYHFMREQVVLGLLITKRISTSNQVDSIFIYTMSKAALSYFKGNICLWF